MNERIRELAKQAGYGSRWNSTDQFEEFLEAYAELIIEKCLEQVRDEVQYEYDWKLADSVTNRVLEYFEVKKNEG